MSAGKDEGKMCEGERELWWNLGKEWMRSRKKWMSASE